MTCMYKACLAKRGDEVVKTADLLLTTGAIVNTPYR